MSLAIEVENMKVVILVVVVVGDVVEEVEEVVELVVVEGSGRGSGQI